MNKRTRTILILLLLLLFLILLSIGGYFLYTFLTSSDTTEGEGTTNATRTEDSTGPSRIADTTGDTTTDTTDDDVGDDDSTADDDDATGSGDDTGDGMEKWVGVWKMTSEQIDSTAGVIDNPATNKIVEFKSDLTVVEDYGSLEGLGECDETKGKYKGTWSVVDSDSAAIDISSAETVTEPYISCGASAGTTAVPRSIVSFSYTGDSWELTLTSDENGFTAVIIGPPGTITQEYVRM